MSEGILKALMQLFALVAAPDQDAASRRKVVRNYLSLHLNNQLIEEYLVLFDQHRQTYRQKLKEKTRIPKLYAASSVRVLRIATAINEELTHYQKTIVIIQLLEFLNSGEGGVSEMENEFADTVAETFNIQAEEYEAIKNFIANLVPQKNKDILIIGGSRERRQEERYIFREFLNTEIYVLNIRSVSLFLVKSNESTELTINGQVLIPHRIQFLRPGGSIRYMHGTPVTFSDIATHFNYSANKTPIVFDVRDISFSFNKRREAGLHPMSFTSHSGQLVGIMGDSGAGKSTLINVLTGIYLPSSGEILLNGIDLHLFPEKLKGLIGYVSQDDLLIEDLTVYQNLFYSTKLCFDHLNSHEIKEKVDHLLGSLGLYEIRNMKVGSPLNKKISGGQRKRLNIALELIREPSVLFLDEPTSGLSSRDSENIMDLLKDLAVKGKLIFVVIHQPSSEIFKMFNQLLVLDTGGYLIYHGDPVGAINYFKSCINHANRDESECPVCGNVNPEQILNIVNSHVLDEYGAPTPVRKIAPDEWFDTFKKVHPSTRKREEKRLPLPEINFQIPDRLGQLKIFFTRDLKSKLANLQYIFINLLEMPALALVLAGLLYYFQAGENSSNQYYFYNNPNIITYIIIAVIIAIFVGLTVSAEEIINDKKILRREAFLNLSRFSYLLSKVGILAILSAIQVALFVWIGNSILQIKDMFLDYWIILFTSAVFANLLGLIISDTLKKTVNIYILIPFLIIPQLILSGVFVSYDRLNPNFSSVSDIPWYGELITARWSFEALAVNQFKNNNYMKEFFLYEKLKSNATYRKDYWYPAMKAELMKTASTSDSQVLKNNVALINNEFSKIAEKLPSRPEFEDIRTFKYTPQKEKSEKASQHLERIKNFYIGLYNEADRRHEEHRRALMREHPESGRFYLTQLRNHYHNEGLERFVRGTDDFFSRRIIRHNNRFVQKFDPVYKEPKHKFIKAHFLAPFKRVGNLQIETYRIDLIVLWAMNFILFILLYNKTLKKLLSKGKNHLRVKKPLVEQ
ncbi:ATP-binding cassette domain-containing protein [Anaerophaga thermohalophila]|uniref:ATP-binding cassette domain-containing protein n=1 Tax=Anaerophaga thermohalophila TaxID=177400 RepID=UPI0002E2DB7A|nr:ATP-binding cassette domain-containing protein [Anaerophaga thermohalophila]